MSLLSDDAGHIRGAGAIGDQPQNLAAGHIAVQLDNAVRLGEVTVDEDTQQHGGLVVPHCGEGGVRGIGVSLKGCTKV